VSFPAGTAATMPGAGTVADSIPVGGGTLMAGAERLHHATRSWQLAWMVLSMCEAGDGAEVPAARRAQDVTVGTMTSCTRASLQCPMV
jgi:hypothetical protein